MKTFLFLIIVIISGFAAGIIHGLVNLITVEPFLDTAIGVENHRLLSTAEIKDIPDFWQKFDAYRLWQKEGAILAGGLLGLASGALFGLVFAYTRGALPSQSHLKKALVLCMIMWLTLFFLPSLKYPANPPAVGDPNTIGLRQTMYAEFVALSGIGALVFSILYRKLRDFKKIIAPVSYAVFIGLLFLIMPDNPDKITISMDVVNSFRAVSAITVAIWWMANGIILGLLWEKFQPHIKKEQIQ